MDEPPLVTILPSSLGAGKEGNKKLRGEDERTAISRSQGRHTWLNDTSFKITRFIKLTMSINRQDFRRGDAKTTNKTVLLKIKDNLPTKKE